MSDKGRDVGCAKLDRCSERRQNHAFHQNGETTQEAIALRLRRHHAIAIAAALSHPDVEVERHPDRQYGSFIAFWPKYVGEHSKPLTKILHGIGTIGTPLLSFGFDAELLLRVCLGLASGISFSLLFVNAFAAYPTGLPEGIVMIVMLVWLMKLFSGRSVASCFLCLASGYIMPWIAHFFVEHNSPATFLHPTFSILGDFVLLGSLLTNQLALNATAP